MEVFFCLIVPKRIVHVLNTRGNKVLEKKRGVYWVESKSILSAIGPVIAITNEKGVKKIYNTPSLSCIFFTF